MPNNWIAALKQWNEKNEGWIMPKKDSPQYKKVMAIKKKLDKKTKKEKPKAKPKPKKKVVEEVFESEEEEELTESE